MRLQDIISSNIYEPNKKYNSKHYLKDLSIFYTEAKITPKKEGFFVTFYKRNNKNEAFSSDDLINYLIIKLNNQQYIFFSKEDLINLNIISFNSIKGKMGFRVYLKKPSNPNSIQMWNNIKDHIYNIQDLEEIIKSWMYK